MGREEQLKLYKKNLKALVDKEINNLCLDLNIVSQDGISDLILEFPSLSFAVSLSQSLIDVNRKEY